MTTDNVAVPKGRKPKLVADPEIITKLVNALRAGNYMEHAADYAGVHVSTVYRWLEKGNAELERREQGFKPDKKLDQLCDLCEAVKKAKGEAVVRAMALIQNAASSGTWQASAWFLERTQPNFFGRKTEIVGEGGGPLRVEVTVEALEAKLTQVMSHMGVIDEPREVIDATSPDEDGDIAEVIA
jgi:IS30 family transposase